MKIVYKPTRFVNIGADQKKHYESLTHEIVGDAVHNGTEEYEQGDIAGIPYILHGEWEQTCCVSFYCPGASELRGYVVFTEDGARHYVDFDEAGYTYRHSYIPEPSEAQPTASLNDESK